MKRTAAILLLLLAFSCTRYFDVDSQVGDSIVYVSFLPSNASDTTILHVQATTPMKKNLEMVMTEGESVSVSVDGSEMDLVKVDSLTGKDGAAAYALKHRFIPGEKVELSASIPGTGSVISSCTVPSAFPDYSFRYWNEGNSESTDMGFYYLCFEIEYENRPECSGNYGIAVIEECRKLVESGYASNQTEPGLVVWTVRSETVKSTSCSFSTVVDLGISSSGEEPMTFELGNNRVFAWSDRSRGKMTQIVRIWPEPDWLRGVEPSEWFWNDPKYENTWSGGRETGTHRYKLVLYSFSDSCFNYLKADFNAYGGGLSELGLTPPSFAYTNISGGAGVCGAYVVSETDWIEIEK